MKNALTFAAVAEAATGLALSTSSMGFSRSPFRFTSCTSTKTPRLAARGAFLWPMSVTGVLVFGLVEHLIPIGVASIDADNRQSW